MCPFPSPGMPVTPVLRTDIVVPLLASRVYVSITVVYFYPES